MKNLQKILVVLLIMAITLADQAYSYLPVYAKEKDRHIDCQDNKKKNCDKNSELIITNLPDDQTLTVNTQWDFDAAVINNRRKNGKCKNEIICFEITCDTAGVGSISDDGIVTPTKPGYFSVRALTFDKQGDYRKWKNNNKKHNDYMENSSQWYTITVIDLPDTTAPTLTLTGDPIVFVKTGDTYIEPGFTAMDDKDGDITGQVAVSGELDTSHSGGYAQIYGVSDSAGNYTFTIRSIIVYDETEIAVPILSLQGDTTQLVQIGSTYTNVDVIAYDRKDGNLTGQIIISGDSVDTTKEGIYYIHYSVQNSDGLSSDMTVKVVVTDLSNPINYIDPSLELNGYQYIYLNSGDTYVEPGYTATDDFDGDISSKVTITSDLDVNIPGTYHITYFVKDSSGNSAQAERIVTVMDNHAPVLTLMGDPVVFLKTGEAYQDPGYTAVDSLDGDLTTQVQVSGNLDTNTFGSYMLCYKVTNSVGYSAFAYRLVRVYSDNQTLSPIFIINAPATELVQIGSSYSYLRLEAYDRKDGNITDQIIIGGDTVDSNREGIYYVTYSVQNSDGISNIFTQKVVVTDLNNPIDSTDPVLTLAGDNYIEIPMGSTFTDPGYTVTDNLDGDITGMVQVEGSVDTNTPGLYELTYRVQDSAGNKVVAWRSIYVMYP